MNLSPEQFNSLKRVLAPAAVGIAGDLKVPKAHIENVVGVLELITRKHSVAFGNGRLLIIYVPGHDGTQTLSPSVIADLIRREQFLVNIGDNGSMISSSQGEASLMSAASASESGPTMSALCQAGHFSLWSCGRVVGDVLTGTGIPRGRADWTHSARDFHLVSECQFKHMIEREQLVQYWEDKGKRILRSPDTEELFHRPLFWWCQFHVEDALRVYGEAQGMGQDKTDINIVTTWGTVIIEVKWLGRNRLGTVWAKDRIHAGILQVKDYLDRDSDLVLGYLVVYDARQEDEHKTQSEYPESDLHPRCEVPIIHFLRSENPSDRAGRLARKGAVKKNVGKAKGGEGATSSKAKSVKNVKIKTVQKTGRKRP